MDLFPITTVKVVPDRVVVMPGRPLLEEVRKSVLGAGLL